MEDTTAPDPQGGTCLHRKASMTELESKPDSRRATIAVVNAGIPLKFQKARMASHPQNRREAVWKWLTCLPRGLAFFTGPAGTGKTHMAYAIFRTERYYGHKPIFYGVADLCVAISESGSAQSLNPRFVEKVRQNPEMLVLDDLGAERLTDWVFQGLYRIIDYREKNELPTVITSNLSLAQVADKFSDRIASRLSGGTVIEFTGEDKRLS